MENNVYKYLFHATRATHTQLHIDMLKITYRRYRTILFTSIYQTARILLLLYKIDSWLFEHKDKFECIIIIYHIKACTENIVFASYIGCFCPDILYILLAYVYYNIDRNAMCAGAQVI